MIFSDQFLEYLIFRIKVLKKTLFRRKILLNREYYVYFLINFRKRYRIFN